jgi:S1-C subfamily serine protease
MVMQFLIDIIVAILATYLAFTSLLAEKIISFIPETETNVVVVDVVENEKTSVTSLPSIYDAIKIPDILLRSAEYQKASVISSSVDTGNITKNPIEAIVNIFCTFTTSDTIRTTTGTGFFIHSDGVILTNAHVAQYLLFEDSDFLGKSECFIRSGNPAKAKYRAGLLYIPPAWVQHNAPLISSVAPMGTGERDYALLYVSSTLTKEPLPSKFPTLAFNTDLLSKEIIGTGVEAAGYPATDLIKNGANTPLIPIAANTTISELYTFGSNYADVFSIKGSSVGAEGSSGGPVLALDGSVIGMIATRGDDIADGTGSLRAITISHIHRTILEETGFSLEKNIGGNLKYRSSIFTKTLSPFLISLLTQEIKS